MPRKTTMPAWAAAEFATREQSMQAQREKRLHVEYEFEPKSEHATLDQLRREFWNADSVLGGEMDQAGVAESTKRRILVEAFDCSYDRSPQLWAQQRAKLKQEYERTQTVVALAVGPVTYRLRTPRTPRITPSGSDRWEFSLDGFSPRFVGKGKSIAEAKRDLFVQAHVAFQSLVRLRPFQMSEAQAADWRLLRSLIDVDRYWDSVPVTLLEMGVVSTTARDGLEVAWLDSGRREMVRFEQSAPECAAFREGQWFEALVEREPKTYQLRRFRYVRPTEPIREMSDDEFRKWLSSLPGDEDIPKSATDWATL